MGISSLVRSLGGIVFSLRGRRASQVDRIYPSVEWSVDVFLPASRASTQLCVPWQRMHASLVGRAVISREASR